MTNPSKYTNRLNELLKTHFKLNALKPLQIEVITNILQGRDVIGILPTGFGKSICFQLPYLYTKKNVIVISPLLALMDDQMAGLKRLGIPVCCLNSLNKSKQDDLDSIYSGEAKIIYITPEYLLSNDQMIAELYAEDSICLICIDEAHVMSSWGNGFRSSYLDLKRLRDLAPSVPILALSATATEKIQGDIKKNLKLRDPAKIIGDFNRPNLFLSINPLESDGFDQQIKPLLEKYKGDKILIYCKTRSTTDAVSKRVNKMGIECHPYHAEIDSKTRQSVQTRFTDGTIQCICATIAFGMGINIPDIRVVIHYNSPGNLESYYQEIGRAGRDGV
jgi:ATP-dependent DNA helicase RecQ